MSYSAKVGDVVRLQSGGRDFTVINDFHNMTDSIRIASMSDRGLYQEATVLKEAVVVVRVSKR